MLVEEIFFSSLVKSSVLQGERSWDQIPSETLYFSEIKYALQLHIPYLYIYVYVYTNCIHINCLFFCVSFLCFLILFITVLHYIHIKGRQLNLIKITLHWVFSIVFFSILCIFIFGEVFHGICFLFGFLCTAPKYSKNKKNTTNINKCFYIMLYYL